MSTTTLAEPTALAAPAPSNVPVVHYSGSSISKPVRNLKKTSAAAMKPPQMVPDETHQDNHDYRLVFVTEGGTEHREKCTFEVWKKAHGYPTPHSVEPTTKGYKGLINARFLVGFPTENGSVDKIVTSVDIIHLVPPISNGVRMSELEGKKTITINIDPYSGEVEVLKYPQTTNPRIFQNLIAELDKTAHIVPGMLLGGHSVSSVSGTTIEVLATL